MIPNLFISLICVSTASLKLTGKGAPGWERGGYPRPFMSATGFAELVGVALLWWPGFEIDGAAGVVLVLLGTLANLGPTRERLTHLAFTALALLLVLAQSYRLPPPEVEKSR
ncbi:MAG: DoxX family protein [Solirubrobacterales bacterium]|nr:DoxX family protein [Solirubrobacterales bacterium]